MAAARVTTGSIATGATGGSAVTRVLFTSRPYLVSQRFTTDTDKIYVDTASDDGAFVEHMAKELAKANTVILSTQVEAHPKIKSKPFQGVYLAHVVVRPPPSSGGVGIGGAGTGGVVQTDRLSVSFQFTVRSGCAVQVISRAADSVDVLIALNSAGYTSPDLPTRNERTWTRDDIAQLDPNAGDWYLKAEVWSAIVHLLGLGAILTPVVGAILARGIKTDQYDTSKMTSVNILDASRAVTAFADNIPSGQGVVQNDNQPYPIYGWLELRYVPSEVSLG
jgi:hypothetical protein